MHAVVNSELRLQVCMWKKRKGQGTIQAFSAQGTEKMLTAKCCSCLPVVKVRALQKQSHLP